MPDPVDSFIASDMLHLAIALAIGLLIGLERGWKRRQTEAGQRVAGMRTFGLFGLLGGASGLLAAEMGAVFTGLVFIGLAGALITAYVASRKHDDRVGITSMIAALITFLLGVLATTGELALASTSAVVMVLLLGYKTRLHRWVSELKRSELVAGFKLLLISVVLLPVLPNRGFGPWEALNPFVIWWMVVMIASISFLGYFAIRIAGARRGTAFTGLFGGLASSTGVTLQLSRVARRGQAPSAVLAGGILLACGTMFPRMLLLATVFNPALFQLLLLPAAVMALVTCLPIPAYLGKGNDPGGDEETILKNPVELKWAVGFGLLLATIMLLAEALQAWLGDAGVWLLSASSGIADVDAITLSLARMSQEDLAVSIAAMGMIIAAGVNSLIKGGLAALIGGRELGLRVGLPLLLAALAGLLTAWLLLAP